MTKLKSNQSNQAPMEISGFYTSRDITETTESYPPLDATVSYHSVVAGDSSYDIYTLYYDNAMSEDSYIG